MLLASDVRTGMVLKEGDDLFQVTEAQYHAGTAKMSGFIHFWLKNLSTGNMTERKLKPEEKVTEIELEQQTLDFLYDGGDMFYYMNPQNYEQYPVPKEMIGKAVEYPLAKIKISAGFYEGKIVFVNLPQTVELEVTSTTQPGHHEQDSTFKPAVLEHGREVLVPHFIKQGEFVKIDIQTGKYMDRVKTAKK